MINFILIIVCISLGFLVKYRRLVPTDAHKGINSWIINIALPAVSFKYLPKVTWTTDMVFPILAMFILAFGAFIYIYLYQKIKGYSIRTACSLWLAAGFANTSFIGFPLVSAYFGEPALSIAVICDQTMFLILSTFGVIYSIKASTPGTGGIDWRFIMWRLLKFPPFMACITALLIGLFAVDITMVEPLFDKLAATLGPLALFSIGLQLSFKGWQKKISQISVVVFYKLAVGPALVLFIAYLISRNSEIARITVFETAMPTLVTSGILAEQFKLKASLVNLVIGVSILLGFATTGVWYLILSYL